MIEKQMVTLIFGRVVLESHLMGTDVRVYSDDFRSYSQQVDPGVCLKLPLQELPQKLREDDIPELVQLLFTPVKHELEASYQGGFGRACSELQAWLLEHQG